MAPRKRPQRQKQQCSYCHRWFDTLITLHGKPACFGCADNPY
jgi:hypothetical protein